MTEMYAVGQPSSATGDHRAAGLNRHHQIRRPPFGEQRQERPRIIGIADDVVLHHVPLHRGPVGKIVVLRPRRRPDGDRVADLTERLHIER